MHVHPLYGALERLRTSAGEWAYVALYRLGYTAWVLYGGLQAGWGPAFLCCAPRG